MEHLTSLLKSKQLKVTPQRLAIFNVLYNTVEHPNAEIIYKALHATHPTMSLATVYKTLDTLKKCNLIQELNVGEDSFRYDANAMSHPHLICTTCLKVSDLHTDVLDNVIATAQAETDFDIKTEKIFFYGTCPDCKTTH